jgi:hypothetical protein
MIFISFHVIYIKIVAKSTTSGFNLLIISSKLGKEFHNKVECQQRTLNINRSTGATTLDGCITSNRASISQIATKN